MLPDDFPIVVKRNFQHRVVACPAEDFAIYSSVLEDSESFFGR
ncbi:MAG: hypothetical protein ACE361_05595 [Aureliella sp.]